MHFEPQVSADCYNRTAFHPLRIESITEQLRILSCLRSSSVLEVGVGLGLIKAFLSKVPTVTLKTLDIATDLSPDYTGSVLEMPFENNSFDTILCCQVLEHLPFSSFSIALKEIYRVTRKYAIISIPDKRRRLGLGIALFRYGWHKLEVNFPRFRSFKLIPEHYWELGHSHQTRNSAVRSKILQAGFLVERQYRLERHEWHCFFILKKES